MDADLRIWFAKYMFLKTALRPQHFPENVKQNEKTMYFISCK